MQVLPTIPHHYLRTIYAGLFGQMADQLVDRFLSGFRQLRQAVLLLLRIIDPADHISSIHGLRVEHFAGGQAHRSSGPTNIRPRWWCQVNRHAMFFVPGPQRFPIDDHIPSRPISVPGESARAKIAK